jgi:hypothetical protein
VAVATIASAVSAAIPASFFLISAVSRAAADPSRSTAIGYFAVSLFISLACGAFAGRLSPHYGALVATAASLIVTLLAQTIAAPIVDYVDHRFSGSIPGQLIVSTIAFVPPPGVLTYVVLLLVGRRVRRLIKQSNI